MGDAKLQAFAARMQSALEQRDQRREYETASRGPVGRFLLDGLHLEFDELLGEMFKHPEHDEAEITRRAVSVAKFAFFIAEFYGEPLP